ASGGSRSDSANFPDTRWVHRRLRLTGHFSNSGLQLEKDFKRHLYKRPLGDPWEMLMNPFTNEVAVSNLAPRRKHEDLAFHSSPATTLGVELELQILDRETGDLAPGAVRILEACAADSIQGASAELMQSMLEIKTGVCANVAAVRDQLRPLLARVR